MRFDGTTALVTGGGSGIGAACARLLAAEGASVAILDRDAATATGVASEITGAGGRAAAWTVDVGDEGSVHDAIHAAAAALSQPAILVTAAGIFHGPDLAMPHEVTLDDFLTVLRVNLVGTFLTVKHALPHLVEGGGSVVTIASTAALRGHGVGSGYSASKGGVDAFTRLLAVRYGPHGVRANCVCPGGTDTPMTAGIFAGPEARERAARAVPLGTWATPEQIASVVAFLASDDASHVTGQTITVDGGATIA
jgi:NAD(P)-dependent dehydrogenase (short-subunit alcohol dehydrogenase family)